MKFSERYGYTKPSDELQYDEISRDLKNSLWNTFHEHFFNKIGDYSSGPMTSRQKICIHIWKEFFKNEIDEIPQYTGASLEVCPDGVFKYIKERFFTFRWYEIYNFIEFIAEIDLKVPVGFITACNCILKRESAGYRIIEDKVVRITSQEEIDEINTALSVTQDKYQEVYEHLKIALDELSRKMNPVYCTSINESIFAIEALAKIISCDQNASLDQALTMMEAKHNLPLQLRPALNIFYGYTRDSGGIRHSLGLTEKKVNFETAKFMYISCVALINYMLSLS